MCREKRQSESFAVNTLYSEEGGRGLYEELPENTFTRTISNPEVVMKKQREQKFEQKLKELASLGLRGDLGSGAHKSGKKDD